MIVGENGELNLGWGYELFAAGVVLRHIVDCRQLWPTCSLLLWPRLRSLDIGADSNLIPQVKLCSHRVSGAWGTCVSGRRLASYFPGGARMEKDEEEVRGEVSRRECCWCQAPDRLTFIGVTLGSCLSVVSTLTRHSQLPQPWLASRARLLGRLRAHVTSVHRSNLNRDRTRHRRHRGATSSTS